MPRSNHKPPEVISSGSVSVDINGKTYVGSYTHKTDGMISVGCNYGHKSAKALQGAPGRVPEQQSLARILLREIIDQKAGR